MNPFVRNVVLLFGAACVGGWQGEVAAWGQHSRSETARPADVHIVQIQRRSAGPEQVVFFADTHGDVHAGESVEVKFDKELDKVSLRIDSEKEWTLLQKADRDLVWKLLVPARLATVNMPVSSHSFSFYGSLAGDPDTRVFCGSRAITVYPPPDARVDRIEQQSLNSKTSDVQYLTVDGGGFFAPLDQIHLTIGGRPAINKGVSANGKRLYAEFNPRDLAGNQPVRLEIWDTYAAFKEMSAEQIQIQRYADELGSLGIAAGAFLLMAAMVLALANEKSKLRLPRPLEKMLLEKQNNTYSLSSFQFYWWGSIIILAWLFIFAARGVLANDWRFPSLSGFAYTLLISLGTLVGAQAANATRGPKGSGTVHPSLSDLIVQGGVVAPERVQQFVWTVLSGIAYVFIIVKSFQTISALPVIPNEMLVIMGISSAGYIGGKFARKPGPIISEVTTKSSRDIVISGSKLSVKPRIWLNGTELPPTAIEAVQFDSEFPTEFATGVHVTLPASPAFAWHNPASLGDTRTIKLMNADGQSSDWSGVPTAPARASEWVDPPLAAPEIASTVHDAAPHSSVIITTPPEKILKAVYARQSETEQESPASSDSGQHGKSAGLDHSGAPEPGEATDTADQTQTNRRQNSDREPLP